MAPNVHESRTAPEISGVLDLDGTEQLGLTSTAPVSPVRGFRAVSTGESFADDLAHGSAGEADHRRGSVTVLADPGQETIPADHTNGQSLVVINHKAPPVRPRQGFTGDDPARAATYRRPLVMRLFDKLIADHNTGIDKVQLASPLAARSREYGDLVGGQPFAGGSTGTQKEGIGIQPNTFRVLPDQWDALAVNTGGPAVSESMPDPAQSAASGQVRRFR